MKPEEVLLFETLDHFWVFTAFAFHLVGFLSAIRAVMTSRTSQGAVAWAIALLSFPYLSVPLFWIFGRDKFSGYAIARRNRDLNAAFRQRFKSIAHSQVPGIDQGVTRVFESLAQMRFRGGNKATLCIDGEATFKAIFSGIDEAKEYILVQFYIVRDDGLGRALKDRLIAAVQRGVRVHFLFDDIGTYGLPQSYAKELIAAGVELRAFRATKRINRFQINFRNHRKIVVVDGVIAYLGGHNVGDEYLGKDPLLGHFRDTHVAIRGPSATQAQVSFMEDWNWATDSLPLVRWPDDHADNEGGQSVLILPSGPADGQDSCGLFYLQAIESAKQRIWIATPYFVPDASIVSALQLAAMRGVEVKIIVPAKNDNILVYLATFSYLRDLLRYGVKMYCYQNGFMHQKVMLVDGCLASIGSANFDYRSFRLNFEVTALFADASFNEEVEQMLETDLKDTVPFVLKDLTGRSFGFRLAVQVARLMSPIL